MSNVSFKQGIISYQKDINGTPSFLQKTGAGITLLASNSPTVITFSHGSSNYTVEEWTTVSDAWGPFFNVGIYYLYWDISIATGQLSRNFTQLNPMYQSTEPQSPTVDQHWFNTSDFIMRVWNGTKWITVIRVFAGTYNSTTILPQILGSQANIYGEFVTGYIVHDADGLPLRRAGGEFFTTETNIYPHYSPAASSAKFEGNIISVVAAENMEKYSLVALTSANTVVKAKIADITAGKVTNITLLDGGSGYVNTPTVDIVGGDGYGAKAVAVIQDGIVTQINITDPGVGYILTAPTIVIRGGGPAPSEQPSRNAVARASISRLALGLINRDLTPGEAGSLIFRGLVSHDGWNWPDAQCGASVYCGGNGEVTSARPMTAVVQKIGTIVNSKSVYLDIDNETVAALMAGVSTVSTLNVAAPLVKTGTLSDPVVSMPAASSNTDGYMTAALVNEIALNRSAITQETTLRTNEDNFRVLKAGDVMTGPLTLQAGGPLGADLNLTATIDSIPKINLIAALGGRTPSLAFTTPNAPNSRPYVQVGSTADSYLRIDAGLSSDALLYPVLDVRRDGTLDLIGGRITGLAPAIAPTDGVNKGMLDGHANDLNVHITAAQKALLDSTAGITPTEMQALSGVTSNIQVQLDGKLDKIGGIMTGGLYTTRTSFDPTELVTKSFVENAIAGSGNGLTYFRHIQTAASTTWVVTHSLNTIDFTWNALVDDGSGGYLVVQPKEIQITDSNNIVVVWSTPRTGRFTITAVID